VSPNSPSGTGGENPSLQRLLDAIAPAASEELARLMQELRASMAADSTVRIRKALLDKEKEFRKKSEELRVHVEKETGERVGREVTEQLETRFKDEMASQLAGLCTSLEEEARTAAARWDAQQKESQEKADKQRADLKAEIDRWRLLAEFHRRVGDASSQVEILKRFLTAADRFATGVALYLNKADGLELWDSRGGAPAFPELVSKDTIDPEWYFAPIVVRSKTVAAVCAAGVKDRDSLVVLVDVLKKAIENFGLRIRFFGMGGTLDSHPVGEGRVEPPTEDPVDDEQLRSDARRLARMLVSEIKLGNEKEVLEGRKRSDLYPRLRNQIEAGRESYTRNMSPKVADHDYFHEELVKILADNDSDRLGEGYPGPA
jgi:hypothetical protein